jgi:YVTN family beta-propeller protein
MAISTRSPSRPAPLRICRLLAIATFVFGFLASAQTLAQTSDAYIANSASNDVFTIDTATNGRFRTISAGEHPFGVAVTPDG